VLSRLPANPVLPTVEPPGRGVVRVAWVEGRSVVATARATSPLRLLAPRNHGEGAWIYTSSFGGGLVDGDDVRLDVEVDARATALVATQASTKVYRGSAHAQTTARVGDDALLALLPDPVVPFAGASYAQRTEIDLAPRGSLALVEAFTAGRSAHGERWRFSRYESRLVVRRAGRLLLLDPIRLAADDIQIAARMRRFDAIATIVLVGPRLASAIADTLREIGAMPVERRAERIVVASPLGEDAAVVRIAVTSAGELPQEVRRWLAFVPRLLGDDPFARRP
jgi:urease accessory protein